MNYLAIDTSGPWLTVAVGGEKKANRFLPDCKLNHSVVLMKTVDECLKEAHLTAKDIDVFACAVGAGSFTGIRIGIATVKAFAFAFGKKVLGVTSFESLAYDISDGNDRLCAIDARHGNFYACGFDGTNNVVYPPKFIGAEQIEKLSKDYEIVCDAKNEYLSDYIVADPSRGFINAVESKLSFATYDRESLAPLYVKKSQAEEEL